MKRISKEENVYFHLNFRAIEKVVGSPLYILRNLARNKPDDEKIPDGISLLPGPTTLHDCTSKEYFPTDSTVKKIVAFCNKAFSLPHVLEPEQFLSQKIAFPTKLEKARFARQREWHIGRYYCYYISPRSSHNRLLGGILDIRRQETDPSVLSAFLITGIREDDQFAQIESAIFRKSATSTSISTNFFEYRDHLPSHERRIVFYEGTIYLCQQATLIELWRSEVNHDEMLFLSLYSHPHSYQNRFRGGLALVTSPPFSNSGLQVYLMGLSREKLSLKNETIKEYLLLPPKGDYTLTMSYNMDYEWFDDLILPLENHI